MEDGMVIYSERLRLIPCDAVVARVAAESPFELAELLGVRVQDEWPAADLAEVLPAYAEVLEMDPSLLGWGVWLILDREGTTLVGDIGFKGPPDAEGTIEVGYGVLESYRGAGYATEAVLALLRWASGKPGVRQITAASLVENRASARVLEKVGFRRVGLDDGIVEWSLALGAGR